VNMFMSKGGMKSMLYYMLGSYFPQLVFSNKEAFADFSIKQMFFTAVRESGYMHIQATKPDTVGVALNDSPIGLLAYILEKFSTWTNPEFRYLPDGGLEKKFTKDELLTMITIYWVTQTILPSQRYYKEYFSEPDRMAFADQYIEVPFAYAGFPHDLLGLVPIEILREGANVTHYALMKDGGHFAAFEAPKELSADVFKFAKVLRL